MRGGSRATIRLGHLLWSLCISLIVLGCRGKVEKEELQASETGGRAAAPPPIPELTAAFLTRAQSALVERVGSQARLLEIRAEGRNLSYVLQKGVGLMQVDYVEEGPLGAPGAKEVTSPSTPVGRIYGPDTVAVASDGPLEDNLFDLKEVQLAGVARSFEVALRAVDPDHGRVTSVVIRRFLPFSTAVRARIYVTSPKMSGSIDTNERGIPLKKR